MRVDRARAAIFGSWLALWAASCHLVVGVDEDVRALPAEWEGPFVVLVSDTVPNQCPSGMPEQSIVGRDLRVEPTAADPCGCTLPLTACGHVASVHDSACKSLGQDSPLVANDCTPLVLDEEYVQVRPEENPARCTAAAPSLTPPSWGTSARLCTACGDDGCLDTPSGATSCIARAGDHPCPEASFPHRATFYESIRDERSCDCGVPECEGAVAWFDDLPPFDALKWCTEGAPAAVPAQVGECVGPISGRYLQYKLFDAACQRTGPAAVVGDATPEAPRTLCCTAPI